MIAKKPEIAILDDEQESFSARLRELIGTRSVRAAATDWGLAYSTLNNYLTKGTEPLLKIAQSVAKKERVSLDWLATGCGSRHPLDGVEAVTSSQGNADFKSREKWLLIADSLEDSEINLLIRAIHKIGVQGLLDAGRSPLSGYDVEKVISEMPINENARQLFKVVLAAGDEAQREILQAAKIATHTDAPDTTSVDQRTTNKVVG